MDKFLNEYSTKYRILHSFLRSRLGRCCLFDLSAPHVHRAHVTSAKIHRTGKIIRGEIGSAFGSGIADYPIVTARLVVHANRPDFDISKPVATDAFLHGYAA